jgi:hypothetical protein
MKRFAIALLLCTVFLTSGCASLRNKWAANGSIFTETRGDYIAISQSGGEIMDCWILEEMFVESENRSDGWRFIDNDGNVIHVGGDAKVIRIGKGNRALMQKYNEYHMEFEDETYRQKFGKKVCGRYHLRGRTKRFFGRVA